MILTIISILILLLTTGIFLTLWLLEKASPDCPECTKCQECTKCKDCQECTKCPECQKCQECTKCPECQKCTCPTCYATTAAECATKLTNKYDTCMKEMLNVNSGCYVDKNSLTINMACVGPKV
jgi:hypothetical protein